jgi:hypothetical protein
VAAAAAVGVNKVVETAVEAVAEVATVVVAASAGSVAVAAGVVIRLGRLAVAARQARFRAAEKVLRAHLAAARDPLDPSKVANAVVMEQPGHLAADGREVAVKAAAATQSVVRSADLPRVAPILAPARSVAKLEGGRSRDRGLAVVLHRTARSFVPIGAASVRSSAMRSARRFAIVSLAINP